MSRKCDLCGKGPVRGYQITRRGLAKRKGGVGKKITGRNKRNFRPNLQYVRAVVAGEIVRMRICTGCLKRGKIVKPAQKNRPLVAVTAPPEAEQTKETSAEETTEEKPKESEE